MRAPADAETIEGARLGLGSEAAGERLPAPVRS